MRPGQATKHTTGRKDTTLNVSLLNLIESAVQWIALENQESPFYVVSEVTLRGQNPSLKFCYPLELYTQLKMGLDLLLLRIWGL